MTSACGVVFLFDEVLVGFLDKFTVVKKLADDLDIHLQPTCPGSVIDRKSVV